MTALPAHIVSAVLDHAARTANVDEEACGVVTRIPGGSWLAATAMANVAADKTHTYALDPAEQLRVWQQTYNAGHEIGAVYHSHNHGRPTPSPLDIAQWTMPDAFMLIAYGNSLHAWRIVGDVAYHEEAISVAS